ncbi:hypothetical protein UVI_02064200 [Ustilaginoidea virens]|uniref:Telomere length regulation protein conserved domain-containing protein n=1 Tax=Ustilaginoidea virens TaxID=1159556 RepID=A0A1B5LAJ7_USTVR|nr:hypothetical protein UVI_02064200 [Ustilaginoidea virens]
MDQLLSPVRTTYLRAKTNQASPAAAATASPPPQISSADDVLSVLKGQPDHDSLVAVLRFLTDRRGQRGFDIHIPSPRSAAIVSVLVNETVPNYWPVLKGPSLVEEEQEPASALPRSPDARRLVACLQSVAGINALLSRIRADVQESRLGEQHVKRPGPNLHLGVFLDFLAAVLDGDGSLRRLWQSSTARDARATSNNNNKFQSQSLIALITGGRVISTTAEALVVAGGQDAVPARARWLTAGVEFSRWIGRNVATWAKLQPDDVSELDFCSDIFHRSLSLGYADELLLSKQVLQRALFAEVCLRQPQASKKVMAILLEYLARRFLSGLQPENLEPDARVSAAAGLISDVLRNDAGRISHLVSWCTSPSGAGLGDAIGIRRAVVAVLARDKETVASVLDQSLSQFGDQLYIKHAAILQQEAHAQVLLLSAGYVAKLAPLKLNMTLRSASYLTTISNRIASTHARARFLGMCVGEALSALVDKPATKLDFNMDESNVEEAQWFKALTKTSDEVGPAEALLLSSPPETPAEETPKLRQIAKTTTKSTARQHKPAAVKHAQRAIIEEIDSSDNDEEDDDFPVIDKASDREDSDDDATLVRRDRPKPPVYVRDLITFLRDSESYDKQALGLRTAPVLIRRKANYGSEVSSHAEELARALMGVQNKFDIENFDDLHLESMVALVVAQPKPMAPWFARTFFEGDYSLSQRTAVLVTLGISARQLAGIETSEYQSISNFPSKRLPEKIEQLYLDGSPETRKDSQLKALPPNALDSITQSLTASFLGPLAAEAADANSGPDALKLQTFAARYKSKLKGARPRIRAIANSTAALLATCFFFPLTAHFQFALRSSKPVVLNPAMLALYLQTLGVVVNAAGPSTLSLPQITAELLDLLLRVRVHVLGDIGALKGWLVAMSVLLEVNEENARRLCQEQGREVVESRDWVSGVFERIRGEDGGEENDVKMLAAGVLIKLGDMIERSQALLLGDLIGFN